MVSRSGEQLVGSGEKGRTALMALTSSGSFDCALALRDAPLRMTGVLMKQTAAGAEAFMGMPEYRKI
jgi:hypothetical protein